MYGDLIQLTGHRGRAGTKWQRVPLTTTGKGKKVAINEGTLQSVLFRNADILPLGEIDSAYKNAVPICTELSTRAGSVDALYLTPAGRIVLAEFKLWRNPTARREVIGQILDYASALASWNYDALEARVKRRTRRTPFAIVRAAHPKVEEHRFIDSVARSLRHGTFLLLIIGDGIREGVRDIVAYVREHSGLHLDLALIEAAVYRRNRGGELIVQPRVLAQTELMPREVLVPIGIGQAGGEARRDDPEGGVTSERVEGQRFWAAVVEDFAFADPEANALLNRQWKTVLVAGSGYGGWGLFFSAFFNHNTSTIGTYLGWRKGIPKAERIYGEIRDDLIDGEELGSVLAGWKDMRNPDGRPRLGFSRAVKLDNDTTIRDFDEAVQWMRHHFNLLVSTLHPECRRRLRAHRR